eukprot:1578245-Rhodomonas_salina.1
MQPPSVQGAVGRMAIVGREGRESACVLEASVAGAVVPVAACTHRHATETHAETQRHRDTDTDTDTRTHRNTDAQTPLK